MTIVFIATDGSETRVRCVRPMVNQWGNLLDLGELGPPIATVRAISAVDGIPPRCEWVDRNGNVWGAFRVEP